jgi:hypothetical protein
MRRRDLPLLAFTLFAAGIGAPGAQAGEHGDDKKGGKGDGQYIDVSPIALPIVVDGRLINYVFVSVRVNLAPFAEASVLRDKEPFLRDALVRAGHRAPFTDPHDYTRVDEARLKASLFHDAAAILGARNVAGVSVVSQTPKQRSGLPAPKA